MIPAFIFLCLSAIIGGFVRAVQGKISVPEYLCMAFMATAALVVIFKFVPAESL